MDTISGHITHINFESLPTPPSSESNTTTQEPPDITNTLTTTSIDELRCFSTALSAFISCYDELHNHINFINSSIDSKLPNHLVQGTNPNLLALTRLLETYCDQTITASPDVIVLEQNPKESVSDCERSHESARTPDSTRFSHNYEEIDASKNLEVANISKNPVEINVSKNLEEIGASEKHAETDTSKKPEESVPEEQNPNGMATNSQQSHEDVILLVSGSLEEINVLKKPEQTDICKNPEEAFVLKKHEEVDTSMVPEETDTSEKPEETVPESSCNKIITLVPEAIVSVQNPKQSEQTDICKNREETVVLKKPEEVDTSMMPEEIDTRKKPEETVSETCCDQITPVVQEATVSKQNFNRMATNHQQSHENDILNMPEQTDICKNPEETVVLKKLKKHKKTEASKKSMISVLESLCQSMRSKEMRRHIATHFSEMVNLREEIAKSLKLAKDPAKLVLTSIGKFFVHDSKTYCNAPQKKANRRRMAAVLILECFVMISSDGIKITKREQIRAAKAAVDWRKRMIGEGGLGHTDEVDSRGLLLLISGFGFQEQVFTVQDIMDFILASNVKGISTALRRSVFLFPKIPKVINWMVQNNLEIEAVNVAYTFQLEDMSRDILTTYLHTKIKDLQNSLSSETLEAMKQHLFDLKTVKQCLESHNVDLSTLLPEFKISETIQNIEKEVNEWKLTQKRKFLETPFHNEAKRVCFENVTPPETLEESNLMKPEQTDTCKDPEETVLETSCVQTTSTVPEAVVSEQNPHGIHEHMRTPENHEEIDALKNPEIIDVSKKLEQTDILNKPEKIDISKKHDKTGPSKKFVISMLQNLCQSMSHKELKWHVAAHYSEMSNLRVEIANALRLAEDPAKLVLNSVGRFFVQNSRTFRKGVGPHQDKQNQGRMAAVLILECFVMISSDGIKIAKTERECAAKAAVDWRKRMIKEGGFGHTDEVDARGLLLLISGFGIKDNVFKIQDIMDLIRASNVKGISTALCRSASLIPKIPKVIYWMVQSNLEIEAVDLAYTFGMEDMCHPRNILTTYLHNKIKDFQNSSSSEMLEAVKQHLFDLKSVKECLESHNVDPSTLLPDFKINEKIQNLEKEVNEWKSIQKRKSLENPIHQEVKRACLGHQNIPPQQKPVDHNGMNRFDRSPQPSTSHFDSDQNLSNSYVTNHSPSYVHNASTMPGNIPDPVPNGQHHSRHDQAYDSQPYYGPWERDQLESFPGFLGRPGPSSGLYSFADIVEKECMR